MDTPQRIWKVSPAAETTLPLSAGHWKSGGVALGLLGAAGEGVRLAEGIGTIAGAEAPATRTDDVAEAKALVVPADAPTVADELPASDEALVEDNVPRLANDNDADGVDTDMTDVDGNEGDATDTLMPAAADI